MNVLIIEDEKPAAERLQRLVLNVQPQAKILAVLASVSQAVKWFEQNPLPDLIFLDIQLADGESFEIFRKVNVDAPVIFSTAYDNYVMKAFELNSVDYLLKPISKYDLQKALDKFDRLHQKQETFNYQQLAEIFQQSQKPQYKERFIIRIGEKLLTLAVADVRWFSSKDKVTFAGTTSGKSYPVDYSLDQLEKTLNPETFFRISRQYIVALSAIKEIRTYSSSRLKLVLHQSEDDDILVSRDRVSDFKQWLDR